MSVVENEGVSAAALANGVALSTISRDLSSLEERLGVHLCRRGRGGFELTQQGHNIYRAAVDLQARMRVFELEVQAAKDAVSSSFNIGSNDHVITNPESQLIEAIAHMRQAFPGTLVNVSLHEDTSIDVLVRERRLDIGIIGQPAWLQPLQYTPMFLEEHRLYVGTKYPRRDEIQATLDGGPNGVWAPIPYIARAQKTDGFQYFEERYPLVVTGRSGSLEAVFAAVLSGRGCALMPVRFVQAHQRDDLVELPLKDGPYFVQFYVACRRDAAREKTVRSFISQYE